jgi:hypothetical protein
VGIISRCLFFSRAAISVASQTILIYHHSPLSLFISSLCVLNSCFF